MPIQQGASAAHVSGVTQEGGMGARVLDWRLALVAIALLCLADGLDLIAALSMVAALAFGASRATDCVAECCRRRWDCRWSQWL